MTKGTVIRTTVERDLYLKADAKAKASDTNLSAVLRQLLIEWCDDGPTPDVEQDTWKRLGLWIKDTGYTYPSDLPRKRSAMLKWARTLGFRG